MNDAIEIRDQDGVRVLRINRPEKKNALTHAMYADLAAGLLEVQARADLRVALITGSGEIFTAGNDMMDFAARPPKMTNTAEPPPVARFLNALVEAPKPLVFAVNGLAIGIGVTMLLHGDLVYASDQAQFKMPFTDLGLAPEGASSLLLPALVGQARASELLLCSEQIDAAEAQRLNIVSKLFPQEAVEAEALATAQALAAKAPAALRAAKALLRANKTAVGQRMIEEGAVFEKLLESEEFKEAATAFMERRAPDFSKFS
ncbi:MAG: enoyl-CoA hydratase-related protein [Maricaulaceae bacterium]